MLCYCKKCGRILQNSWGDENYKCDCCKTIMLPVPQKYLLEGFDIAFKDKETEKLLIEELVKTSPEFDEYLFDHREEILAKKHEEFQAKIEHGKAILKEQSHQPECPTCHSKNVQRISGLERGASIVGLGIFSKKMNKSFKCKHCGYTW